MVLTEESSVGGLAGVAPDRKFSRLRRLGRRVRNIALGTGMVFCICLCLLVGVASPSDALVGSLVQFGETIAAPAEVVGEEVAGAAGPAACATGVGTALCVGAFVGTALYMTRDTWWPVVKGFFAGDSDGQTTSNGGNASTSSASLVVSGALTGPTVTFTATYSGFSTYGGNYEIGPITYICRSSTGVITSGASNGGYWTSKGASGSETRSFSLCGTGQTMEYASSRYCLFSGTIPCPTTAPTVTVGNPVQPSDRSTVTTVSCKLPDGTTQTISSTGTGDPSGVPIPSCRGHFPGSVPTSVDVKSGYPGKEQPVDHLTLNDPHADYPDCFDANGAFLNSCVVRVYVDGQPCHVGVAMCSSWQTADTDYDVDVSCHWGPYVVALSDCDPLANQYRTSTGTKTITQAGTDTGTKLSTSTSGSTGTDPESGSTPTEGTNPDQDAGTDADGNLDKKSCMSQGWSWNPVSWVKVPVECAIEWAFVPDSPLPEIAAPGLAAWLVPLGTLDSDCGGWLTTIPLGVGSYSGEFPISLPTTCDGIGGVTSDITRGICPALFGFIAAVRVYRRAIRSVG